jgi:hypothetical protein
MADKSMKAVIRAEVDPSGVIKGVAATNRELQKLNSKTSAIAIGASFNMAQQGFQILMHAFQMIDRRMQEITALSSRFSPEAQRGIMETTMAKINDEIKYAKAFGPDVAGAERAKRSGMEARTATDLASAGSGQLSFTESMKQSGSTLINTMMDQFIMTFADPSKKFSRENMSSIFSNFGLGMGTSGQEATRGMSDNPRRDEQVLMEINRTLKGGS